MLHQSRTRSPGRLLPSACVASLLAVAASTGSQASPGEPTQWVVPRTPDGHPDLQGDWTNATLTPMQRPEGRDRVLTPEQIAEMEGRRRNLTDSLARPSDANREAPPRGGFGEAGSVGGYNYFYMDAGDRVAVFNGEPRSSIVVDPPDGRFPALTPEAERRRNEEEAERTVRFGPFDNPENLTLSDRCIMSHGSHVPLLPNYAYNNNYTIVQTPDYVVIATEMIHDVRIIRLGERRPLPEDQYPWLGYSWGRWEGDTLVVETTNIPSSESNAQLFFPGGSDDMKVIERFTRPDEHTINYEFTVEDPATYVSSWSGEVPFRTLDGRLYEYACHEGNYALPDILSGARAREREGSDSSPSGTAASRLASPSGARLETVELTSRVFGNTRTLRVLLPAGYDEDDRRYPVLYMLDGQTLFDPADSYTPAVWEVDETVPRLIAEGAIEPLIVVGIDNAGLRERPNELLPWYDESLTPPLPDPQGKHFPDFLANEVIPLIESRYRTLDDRDSRGLAGTSYGGLMALYTVIHRPELFGRLLIESPGFYVRDAAVLEEAEGHDAWPEKIHVAVGTNEEGRPSCDPDDRSSEAVVDVLRLESILRGKGLGPDGLRVRIHPCAQHAELWWGRRFPEALTFLYGRSPGGGGDARREQPAASPPGQEWP